MVAILPLLFIDMLVPQTMFAVRGHVRDSNGLVVSSIRVSLVDENYQPVRTVFADSTGRFEFRGLRPGIYIVRVEPAGMPYEEWSYRLELQPFNQRRSATEEPFLLDITLRFKKGQEEKPEGGTVFWQKAPEAARLEYERALNYLKKNKTEPAIEALEKAIDVFPDYYVALELLGTEYVKSENYAAAVAILKHALEVNEKAPKSFYAMGVAHIKLARYDEAIDWLLKAEALEPMNINVHMMLGVAYGNNRALDRAEASLQKAYQLGGAHAADAHLYLAGIYNKQEKYADAVHELDLFLKEAKDPKDTTQIRGMIEKLKAKQKAKS